MATGALQGARNSYLAVTLDTLSTAVPLRIATRATIGVGLLLMNLLLGGSLSESS